MTSHTKRISPPVDSAIVTPDDENDIPGGPCVLYVGTAGNLHYNNGLGVEVASTPVVAGLFPFLVTRVYEDSTASDLIAGNINE